MESIQILERYFNNFITQDDSKHFFIGLADYLDYAEKIPEFDWITTKISNESKPLHDTLAVSEKVALKKIANARKEIGKYVLQKGLGATPAGNALREYDDFFEGRANSSATMPDTLYVRLMDAMVYLHMTPEHKQFTSKYASYSHGDPTQLLDYLPLKELDDFHELKNEIDRAFNVSIWGTQAHLYGLYETIKQGREKYKEIVERYRNKDNKAALEMLTHAGPIAEWAGVEEGRKDRNAVLFVIKNVRPMAQRFHTHVVAHFAEAQKALSVSKLEVPHAKLANIQENKLSSVPSKKPTLLLDGRMGYIKFYKQGPRIPVGKFHTRKYRLLAALWEPIGVAKVIDIVFDAIKDAKDTADGRLKDRYTASLRQREIIDFTIKELQKIKGLKGRVSLSYHHDGSSVALKIK